MSDQTVALTAANIRYLLVINELDKNDGVGVRSVDIARQLGVKKPSVHTMINTLCEKGFAAKEKYEEIHLTPEGRKLAAQYDQCFGLLNGRMQEALSLSPNDYRKALCAILEQTDRDSLNKLCQRLEEIGEMK